MVTQRAWILGERETFSDWKKGNDIKKWQHHKIT